MIDDVTRVMPTGSTTQMSGATMVMESDPFRTQMGGTVTCVVCKAQTPALETYCAECGYLLASMPAELDEPVSDEQLTAALVDSEGKRFRLKPGLNTLGRQDTDILVLDGTVSRLHAHLTLNGAELMVEDMGSSNGTKVGDLRLSANQPTPAASGTRLRFGNWNCTLDIPLIMPFASPAATETEGSESVVTPAETGTETPEAVVGTADTEQAVAILRWSEGPGSDVLLKEGVTTFGRRPDNMVVLLGDAYVSGRHAEINVGTDSATITDMNSTNGTVLNGTKLTPGTPLQLANGDTVQIGQTTYTFARVAAVKVSEEDPIFVRISPDTSMPHTPDNPVEFDDISEVGDANE